MSNSAHGHPGRLGLAVAGAAALAALGCGSEGPGAPAPDGGTVGGARVTLGTGRAAFEPVPPDGHVPLIMGLQGGYHVWTSFLVYGLEASVVRMEIGTRWDGVDGSAEQNAGNVSLRPVQDAAGNPALASLGWPMSIFEPTCADGRRLLFTLEVIDDSGLRLSDSQMWIVDVAPEYRSSDCPP